MLDTAPALHLREIVAIRKVLVAILLILATIAIFFAKDVLLPIMIGVLVSLTLSPLLRVLSKAGIPAPVSATVLVTVLAFSVLLGGYAMSGPASNWAAEVPAFGEKLKDKLRDITTSVEAVQGASAQVEKLAEPAAEPSVQKVTIQQPGLLSSAVSNLAGLGTTIIVAMVFALLLLASGDLFYVKLVEAFPKLSDKKRALSTVYTIERSISRYLFTITVINAVLGMVLAVSLLIIDFPHPFIWGALAFFLNFLPFLGMIIGTCLIAGFSIVTYDQLSYALLAPVFYMVLNSLEGQFVTPTILGRRLEMNTVSVFLTVVFWGWLWGIAGALMAVPFLVCLKVICDNVDALKVPGRFLGVR
ncbi:AI-2E family transporter [Pseudogemmobacter sp. W21_MBD1_M6]|uniref:AI-2E family transporter n=1 Tax=Pseudogemmobacter sp. W21_MBD1_M6 TaxID=3240271 RepID=UPI003F9BE18F